MEKEKFYTIVYKYEEDTQEYTNEYPSYLNAKVAFEQDFKQDNTVEYAILQEVTEYENGYEHIEELEEYYKV